MTTARTFTRFTLVQKLIASYAAMIFFTLAALIWATMGLYALNRTAREIAHTDLLVVTTLTKLRDSLLAQERYAGKYSILKGAEFVELFQRRAQEFEGLLQTLQQVRNIPETATLKARYGKYSATASVLFQGETDAAHSLKATAEELLSTIDAFARGEEARLSATLAAADEKERSTTRTTLILSFTGFLLAFGVATLFIIQFSSSLHKLKKATHRIAEGEFDYDPKIPPGDETGDLAEDFVKMAVRLKELEQISLDASPLTRLPGNIAIEQVLTKRLHEGHPFAVCYADLDNFKSYNDRYGYIKGSELIKMTGEVIYEVVQTHGDMNDFVGHVGGDDFVMVIDADRAEEICAAVIQRFDQEVPKYFSAEDLERGGVDGIDRYGVKRWFPIMTISIAVVICQQDQYKSAVEIARTAAEIKDFVKGKENSNYFLNRRTLPR